MTFAISQLNVREVVGIYAAWAEICDKAESEEGRKIL